MFKCYFTETLNLKGSHSFLSVFIADNIHMFFILSCAAILVATFSFIAVIACRPRHHGSSQVPIWACCNILQHEISFIFQHILYIIQYNTPFYLFIVVRDHVQFPSVSFISHVHKTTTQLQQTDKIYITNHIQLLIHTHTQRESVIALECSVWPQGGCLCSEINYTWATKYVWHKNINIGLPFVIVRGAVLIQNELIYDKQISDFQLTESCLDMCFLQIASSSNALFLKNQESDGQSSILFNFTNMEEGEKEPLLLQFGTQYSS